MDERGEDYLYKRSGRGTDAWNVLKFETLLDNSSCGGQTNQSGAVNSSSTRRSRVLSRNTSNRTIIAQFKSWPVSTSLDSRTLCNSNGQLIWDAVKQRIPDLMLACWSSLYKEWHHSFYSKRRALAAGGQFFKNPPFISPRETRCHDSSNSQGWRAILDCIKQCILQRLAVLGLPCH